MDLLLACALDLDLDSNLSNITPAPVLDGASLTLSFHATAPGGTFSVETSSDLQTWITDGVILSDLDANQNRTASVSMDAPRRYLRLVVSAAPRQ